MLRDDGICHVCGLPGSDEVDHVIALAEGGADDDSNLAPIHSRPCHLQKTADEAERARRREA
jgi:5-methylcytosine-specific restriction protein A